MAYKPEIGDSFREGEQWESPRGTIYIVMGFERPEHKRKQAILRTSGPHTSRRRIKRDWDAVEGWFRIG